MMVTLNIRVYAFISISFPPLKFPFNMFVTHRYTQEHPIVMCEFRRHKPQKIGEQKRSFSHLCRELLKLILNEMVCMMYMTHVVCCKLCLHHTSSDFFFSLFISIGIENIVSLQTAAYMYLTFSCVCVVSCSCPFPHRSK